jgi:hypothetical protein
MAAARWGIDIGQVTADRPDAEAGEVAHRYASTQAASLSNCPYYHIQALVWGNWLIFSIPRQRFLGSFSD